MTLLTNGNSAPATNREFWTGVGNTIRATKDNMQPLLENWLLSGIEGTSGNDSSPIPGGQPANHHAGGDNALQELRQAYLPETVLAYVSALHFAGTGLSRDNLLECMELASVIAERNSDLATAFVNAGRMTELVEAFTACSKALAVSTGEKRTAGTGSKKLREMGWSRDLWSIKQ